MTQKILLVSEDQELKKPIHELETQMLFQPYNLAAVCLEAGGLMRPDSRGQW
jgi:hypothetical protein